MRMDLTDRTALVTGGTSGIGAAIARGLAKAGAHVIVTGIDAAAAASASDEGSGIVTRQLDVTDRQAIAVLFGDIAESRGGVDILVNNAGVVSYHDFLDLDPLEWDRMLAVNLTGAMLCAQHAGRQMSRRGGGRIINITSIAEQRPAPRRAHYCVSKAGLGMLTKSMALELGALGITVNAIGPGTIETYMTKVPLQDAGLKATIVSRTPLGRLGVPQDLVGAAVFLASDAASFITGQTIIVDGGQSL